MCNDFNVENGIVNGMNKIRSEFAQQFDLKKLLEDGTKINYTQIEIQEDKMAACKSGLASARWYLC